MSLKISTTLVLPDEIVTKTIGLLGMRGSGKTTSLIVLAEEMWDRGFPFVLVDPKGDMWGIRSSANGKEPGLPIPVFGGLRGDIPLEAAAGATIADVIVDDNITVVLDVSDFSKGERTRFLIDFFDRLYRRHRRDPQPRHIFLEEAHEYISQMVKSDEARLKDSAARIVLQGRAFGLGASICSQRSARVHKDVLTQSDVLIAMRTTSPQDRKAILAWVEEHDIGKDLVSSLPSLRSGEAWIWAPLEGIVEKVQFRRRRTFDSGATPKVGQPRRVAALADINLGALADRMKAAIERAAENDPKELKRRIKELERELDRKNVPPPPTVVEREVEVLYFPEDAANGLRETVETLKDIAQGVNKAAAEIGYVVSELGRQQQGKPRRTTSTDVRERADESEFPVSSERADEPKTSSVVERARSDGVGQLGKAERAILVALANYPRGKPKKQLGVLTGYSYRGGGFSNSLSSLRTKGYIKRGDPVQITAGGRAALGNSWEPLPTGRALLDYWMTQLGKAEREILRVVWEAWPKVMTKLEVAEATGYVAAGGGFSNAISRLRTLELIFGYKEIRPSEALYDEYEDVAR